MLQGTKEERQALMVAPLPDLVRFIVGSCHQECRTDMARLETLAELHAMEEGRRNPAFIEIRDLVSRFCVDMRSHLAMEERNLFPAIMAVEGAELPAARKEALASVRTLLEGDHEAEASLLRGIRSLAANLAADQDPESPEASLHEAIKTLSEHLQQHLYLENQVLFPRMR